MRDRAKTIAIGLNKVHIAIMDDEELETYETPIFIGGAMQANVVPSINNAQLFADDTLWDTADALGAITVTLGMASIPTHVYAKMMGHNIDQNGVLIRNKDDRAPYVALGYRRKMANGKAKYNWLLKGKFRPEAQNADTQGDTPAYQTPSIEATFMPRDTDGNWQNQVIEGDPNVNSTVISSWFSQVYLQQIDLDPPTVELVTPEHNEEGVSPNIEIEWTFSESIRSSSISTSNFMLLDSNYNQVQGNLNYNSTNEVVTFKPTNVLSQEEEYTVIVTTAVKDLAGNSLETPHITKFTTN